MIGSHFTHRRLKGQVRGAGLEALRVKRAEGLDALRVGVRGAEELIHRLER
jgi:hypothetical protein